MDKRHPYTYAADFVRGLAGYNEHGTKLSRADASQILQGIAKALGETDHSNLAEKLSIYYQDNQEEIEKKNSENLFNAMNR